MRELFNVPKERPARLWNQYVGTTTWEMINKPDSTLNDAGLYTDQVIAIEVVDANGAATGDTPFSAATSRLSKPSLWVTVLCTVFKWV